MPGDPADLTTAPDGLVRRLIADVLAVPLERVQPETALSAELGAESIDYVDLIFRLEDAFAISITVARWTEFLHERLPEGDYGQRITTELVEEFLEGVLRARPVT